MHLSFKNLVFFFFRGGGVLNIPLLNMQSCGSRVPALIFSAEMKNLLEAGVLSWFCYTGFSEAQ